MKLVFYRSFQVDSPHSQWNRNLKLFVNDYNVQQ